MTTASSFLRTGLVAKAASQAATKASAQAVALQRQPWSKRRTLVFIVVVCGAFWGVVAGLVWALVF